MKVLLILLAAVLGGWGLHWRRQAKRWKKNAIMQGRKRLSGADARTKTQTISQRAAHQIWMLNEEVERLGSENQRLRNMNRNLLRQMDRRKAG